MTNFPQPSGGSHHRLAQKPIQPVNRCCNVWLAKEFGLYRRLNCLLEWLRPKLAPKIPTEAIEHVFLNPWECFFRLNNLFRRQDYVVISGHTQALVCVSCFNTQAFFSLVQYLFHTSYFSQILHEELFIMYNPKSLPSTEQYPTNLS